MTEGRSTSLRTSKFIPRDISESLGKLPPQAIESEEYVLGAILLESHAFSQVKEILRPESFYGEVHKEIYQAIVDVHADEKPINSRTIIERLRKTGKLEIIGGMFYIATLTSKVSSSANLQHDARIVVEQAIKREIIQMASRLQSDAYQDETDPFEMLDRATEIINFVKINHISEPAVAKIQAIWKDVILDTEPPEEEPIFSVNGVVVATAGNHSLVLGKKKSRKTLFLVFLIAQYLSNPKHSADDILFFDTEQGKGHVYKIRKKVERLTGKLIPVFYMRGRSPEERQFIIENTLLHWKSKVKLVFIDGVRDLMADINDIKESTNVIVWLERLTLQYNIHVCNVIHMNKGEGDQNARGHIGTELANKAQTVIGLERDKEANCTKVSCMDSRDLPFDEFAFTHDKDELPMIVGVPTKEGEKMDQQEEVNRFKFIFQDDAVLNYKEFLDEVKAHFKCGPQKAKGLMVQAVRNGWVIKSGRSHTPDVRYKLVGSMPTVDINSHQVYEDPEPPVSAQVDLPF
jgi:hypothetical protein